MQATVIQKVKVGMYGGRGGKNDVEIGDLEGELTTIGLSDKTRLLRAKYL
jgi:hypothetical protein